MTRKTIRRALVAGSVGALAFVTVPVEPVHADNQNCGLIPVTNCQYDKEESHHDGGHGGGGGGGQQQQQQQGGSGGGGGGGSSSSSSSSSGSSGSS